LKTLPAENTIRVSIFNYYLFCDEQISCIGFLDLFLNIGGWLHFAVEWLCILVV